MVKMSTEFMKYDLWFARNIPSSPWCRGWMAEDDHWPWFSSSNTSTLCCCCLHYIGSKRGRLRFGTWNLTLWVHLLQLLLPTVMFPPFSSDHWSMISSPVSPLSMFLECGVPVSRHQEMMTCGCQDHPPHPSDYPQPHPARAHFHFSFRLGFLPPSDRWPGWYSVGYESDLMKAAHHQCK